MHNSPAVTPAPLTPPVRACSGGATARSGGDTTGKDDSQRELRSASFSGCLSNYRLPVTHPSDAERLRSIVLRRRRWTETAPTAATRRSRGGLQRSMRIIKLESQTSTDAAQGRNWAEVDSPVPETTNREISREEGSS